MPKYHPTLAFSKTFQLIFTKLNHLTYGGRGFLVLTIRLLTIILKRLYLAPPNLVTFLFCLLDTFWQNFSKSIYRGGGGGGVRVAAVGFEMRRL